MRPKELDLYHLTYLNDPSEDNRDSLMQAIHAVAKQQMVFHNLGADRDDAAQDVVISVMKSLPLKEGTTLSFWIIGVIHNRATDYHRQYARRREDEFVEETIAAHEPEYNFAHTRLKEASGDNFPIIEDLLLGHSMDETAKKHGLSKKAIQNRIQRIRERARNV
jgi:DNA-directed RNA polymerase specialized sigma24 family protein